MKDIDGQCHCGYISYQATVNPEWVFICHCTDCQRRTGGAFSTVVIAAHDKFRITSGEPTIYYRNTERGEKRKIAFCPRCGTPIYASDLSDKPVHSIPMGTARQREELIPKAQIWCRSQLSWVQGINQLPQIAQQPPLPG